MTTDKGRGGERHTTSGLRHPQSTLASLALTHKHPGVSHMLRARAVHGLWVVWGLGRGSSGIYVY